MNTAKRRYYLIGGLAAALVAVGLFVAGKLPSPGDYVCLRGHSDVVNCLSFSPDGELLASGSNDNNIKLWNLRNRQVALTLSGHLSSVRTLSFSPNGKTLASGSSDKTVRLWDVTTGKELAKLACNSGEVLSVCFGQNDQSLVVEARGDPTRVYDLQTKRQEIEIIDHKGSDASDHSGLAVSSDGGTFATIDFVGSAPSIWDLASGKKVTSLAPCQDRLTLLSVAYSSDGKTLATGTWQWTVIIWDLTKGGEIFRHKLNYPVVSVAFSPDGTLIAAAEDRGDFPRPFPKISVLDVENGNEVLSLRGPWAGFNDVKFSSDGKLLAGACRDNTIRLWDMTKLLPRGYQRQDPAGKEAHP